MPGDWSASLGRDFYGRVEFTRYFNRPTGLEPSLSVWIVVESVVSHGSVVLNDAPLGSAGDESAEFDVTQLLAERNCLRIEVESTDRMRCGGIVGEVRLEIRGGDGLSV
jgi:hypothetical protein